MPEVYCVRAEYGSYAKQFIEGGYVAIGWSDIGDVSKLKTKDQIYPLYKNAYPQDTSNLVIGQQVGQIARFLFDIQAGDYVITPDANTELLHVGIVEQDPSYYYGNEKDGCPYLHRRRTKWLPGTYKRSAFSVPFQNTIRASLTVFYISHRDHFFGVIGKNELIPNTPKDSHDPYFDVLDQVLELDAKEFEVLVTHLLAALGFEGAEHTGKTGDGGVDATGELNVSNLAKVKLFCSGQTLQIGNENQFEHGQGATTVHSRRGPGCIYYDGGLSSRRQRGCP